MNSLRYFLAALAIGAIAVWASENMFWSAALPTLTAEELFITWLAYSFCVASAMSAVFLTGVTGFRAAFLGGAIVGWLAEGVIVGTMYQAFPFQLVWTALAWHALISGAVVFGLGRGSVHWPVSRQILVWLAVGLFAGLWAQFWPLERTDLPGGQGLFLYLLGFGGLVPVAHIVLDRLTPLESPPRLVLAVAPALLGVLWIMQSLGTPSVLRLALPVLLLLTVWMMKRLGTGRGLIDLGSPAPNPARHFLFLLAPFTAAMLATLGWGRLGGFEANVLIALTTGPVSLLIYLWLLFRSIRSGKARN